MRIFVEGFSDENFVVGYLKVLFISIISCLFRIVNRKGEFPVVYPKGIF